MIAVPEAFADAAVARDGEDGRAWIAQLPGQVETFCRQWDLSVDGSPMHGYLGLVVPVRRGDELCVLKISWIDDSTVDEGIALSAWNGQGAVRLLETEPAKGALLLERLDHRRSLNEVGITEAVTIAGRLLRRLSIPAPSGLRSVQQMAREIYHNLPQRWERFDRPVPRLLLDQVRDLALQLTTTGENLLVNYDLIYVDILAGMREPWLIVDPKVVAGDPEFGIAQLLWTRLEEIESEGGLDFHFQLLTEAAELDPVLSRSWTIVRCLDYWLWGLSVGLTYDPARCEIIIDRLI